MNLQHLKVRHDTSNVPHIVELLIVVLRSHVHNEWFSYYFDNFLYYMHKIQVHEVHIAYISWKVTK